MMKRTEFLNRLEKGLSGLPERDVAERLAFYSEMIDDRIEEGTAEEDAVAELGELSDIIAGIIAEVPISRLVKEKVKQRSALSVLEIVLLILGSPIWLSLLIAAVAVFVSIYISVWSIIVSLWAVFVSLVACAFSGLLLGIYFVTAGNLSSGLFLISAALILAGLSIISFFGFKIVTKAFILLTKKFALYIKSLFIKKGADK